MARRAVLWGGGLLLAIVLGVSVASLLANPTVGQAVGRRLPANVSAVLADTPLPFMLGACASYPPWQRWECAAQPIAIIGGVSASGAACVVVVPQWRAERELLAQRRGRRGALACSR